MLANNPEFKRNLWLSATPTTLAVIPLLVGLVVLTIFYSSDNMKSFCEYVTYVGVVALSVDLIIVGAKMVTDSIAGEVMANTWDSQRMTSLSPFQMATGKLFGSTIICWYAAAFIAACLLAAAIGLGAAMSGLAVIINCVLVGLFIQALSGVAVLTEIRRAPQGFGARHSGLYLIIAVILLFQYLPTAFMLIDNGYRGTTQLSATIRWFSADMGVAGFQTFSYAIFSFWAVFGLYRNMRAELLVENGPLAWVFFLLTCMVYMAGLWILPEKASTYAHGAMAAFLTAVFWAYAMCLLEPKNIVEFKRLSEKIHEGDKKAFFYRVPLWAVSILLAAAACAAAMLLAGAPDRTSLAGGMPGIRSVLQYDRVLPLSVFLFLARDMGIILFWHMKPNPRRPDLAMLVSLVVVWAILPVMFSAGGSNELVLGVFIPVFKGSTTGRLIPPLVQAVGVWYMVGKRFVTFVLPSGE